MVDSRNVTGDKDDLVVDISRCLRMRFSDNSCRGCVDICPHGAITLSGTLSINAEKCRGCLLCTAVCPVGALEQSEDFSACLSRLSKVPEPILGCIRTKECSNGTVACMGGLSEEHILALSHSLTGKLVLNLSLCCDCHNKQVIDELRQRLKAVSEAGLSNSTCRIIILESAQEINYREESLGRRGFFKSFGSALFKSADIILSSSKAKTERATPYSEKRLPYRRELLNSTRNKVSHDLASRIRYHFDSCASFDDTCTRCQGCVAICPTGALQTELPDALPGFDQLLCSGCGLCREFCLDGALRISSEGDDGNIKVNP